MDRPASPLYLRALRRQTAHIIVRTKGDGTYPNNPQADHDSLLQTHQRSTQAIDLCELADRAWRCQAHDQSVLPAGGLRGKSQAATILMENEDHLPPVRGENIPLLNHK